MLMRRYAVSRALLEDLILGETVRLVSTASWPDRDAYGRILRAVELDGDDVGWLLIRAGLRPSRVEGPDIDEHGDGRLVRHVRERFAEAWMIGQRLTGTLQIPEHRSGRRAQSRAAS